LLTNFERIIDFITLEDEMKI